MRLTLIDGCHDNCNSHNRESPNRDDDVLRSADLCQWSAWSAWTACADPCSGGVRQRYRRPMAFPLGPRCSKQQTQSQSCNTGLCIGIFVDLKHGYQTTGSWATSGPRNPPNKARNIIPMRNHFALGDVLKLFFYLFRLPLVEWQWQQWPSTHLSSRSLNS